MISKQAYMSLSKEEAFKVFDKLQMKLEEKYMFIKDVITKYAQKMLDGGSILHDDSARTLETGIQARPGITVEMSTQTDDFEKVRSFQKKPFREETRNLVLGSSIIAKLEFDKKQFRLIVLYIHTGDTPLMKN